MINPQPQNGDQALSQQVTAAVAAPSDVEETSSGMAPDSVSSLLQAGMDSMQQVLASINNSVSRLQTDFDTKIKYDESKERTIDALHRELQDYREDLSFKILRPLIMDLVSLYDDLHLLVVKYSELDQLLEAGKVASDLKTFISEIEEMVSRYGFEFYQVDSNVFDRSLQKTQKVVNTDNAELDKRIIERCRMGLRYGDRVVRSEVVIAYRYVASGSDAAASAQL